MSGYVYDETPEERAAFIELATRDSWFYGPSGYYRTVGERDGRNNWQPQLVPLEDDEFQGFYNQGYSDGQYWRNRLLATSM